MRVYLFFTIDQLRNSLDIKKQSGLRPVLVISRNVFNEHLGTVIVLALTSQKQRVGFPLTMELEIKKLIKKSWVKISQIRTLSTKRLGKKIDHLPLEQMDEIIDG